jgi:hypothetical protein
VYASGQTLDDDGKLGTLTARGEAKDVPLKNTGAFDPDALSILQSALEQACADLFRQRQERPSEEVRTLLALRIVDCARRGERDPNSLKAYALSGILGDDAV